MYAEGLGIPPDHSEAYRWALEAAKAGNSDAQRAVGWFFAVGSGVDKDVIAARKWLGKAASQGDQSAAQLLETLKP